MQQFSSGAIHVQFWQAPLRKRAVAIAELLNKAVEISSASLGTVPGAEINCVIRIAERQFLHALASTKTIYIEIEDEGQLLSPNHQGLPFVYGILHELAHLLFPMDNSRLVEIVVDFFARYLMKNLWEKYGVAVWPDRYNYVEHDDYRRALVLPIVSKELSDWLTSLLQQPDPAPVREVAQEYLRGPHTSVRMVDAFRKALGAIPEELTELMSFPAVGVFFPAEKTSDFGKNCLGAP